MIMNNEEVQSRYQGEDGDEFVSAMPAIIYGQDDGERMATRIIELESASKKVCLDVEALWMAFGFHMPQSIDTLISLLKETNIRG